MRGWEKNVRKVVPYVPGEQPKEENIIKLNTNENPYPPAPGVKLALERLEAEHLKKYPDPAATELVRALADRYGVKPEQVFVGRRFRRCAGNVVSDVFQFGEAGSVSGYHLFFLRCVGGTVPHSLCTDSAEREV